MKLSLACVALAALPWASASPAQDIPAVSISWKRCTADLVDSAWAKTLGARLECGSMEAAVDQETPALGSLTVGLVRLKAGDPAQRQGSIFFNFGGPGGNPLDFLPSMAYLWATPSPDHPLDGDKRRLADRFDLVAVVPRGLRGGTRLTCRVDETLDGHDPTVDLADWNWAGFVREARAYAEGCATDRLHPYVGTLQHVRDMEQARVALHEPVLNFMGISYGTWVGAFYAAAYPEHAGRIVLDSVMNYAGTFEDQIGNFPYERQALFAQTVLRPALADPRKYGLGTDANAVMARFRDMPHRAREAWASVIDTPAQLVAALTMADWVRKDGEGTRDRLLARIPTYHFSGDANADNEIRSAATDFADSIEQGQVNDPLVASLVDTSIYVAVVCGDTPWQKDSKALRAMANRIADRYPAANGDAITTGLTCAHWLSPPRWRPGTAPLAKAPPMLLIQAEFDPATPLTDAIYAFNASPNAHMIVARNMHAHGVYGMSATPCVERAVGRFLLDGELPEQRLSGCEFVPAPPQRQGRDIPEAPTIDEARDELRQRLRSS